MPEFRHARSGSLNIPNGSAAQAHGQMMPRSPPNTSHVPCKFFRQGACQAGNACPFSHDIGVSTETVCKYFAKGNCKFGPKCANVHVLPDGRRINYGKNGVTIGTSPINLAGRPSPSPVSPTSASSTVYRQGSTSALTSSLYRAEQPSYPIGYTGDEHPHHLGRQPSIDNGIPAIDMPFSTSSYGSPRDEDPTRLGFGLSPANGKGLSILDAPLPASFDSNGISHAARFPSAPWPSSVPNKFGLESPTPSLSNAKDSRTSETLKLLHTSAFGSSEHLVTPIAGSPPNSQPFDEEYFGKRAMHSSRYARPRMLSSSLPKTSVDRDWEAEFAFGDDGDNGPENYVPENLQDLLTPAEKARRGSMRAEDPVIEGFSKYGSPIGSSPSRWGSLFQRQKEEEDAARAARSSTSAFGHVGSPLRKSTLAQEMGEESRSPNGGPRLSSMRSGSESMSVLSQQLQRSRLDDNMSGSSPLLHPTTARISGGGIGAIGKDRAMERHVSSGSISSSVTGRFTTPIDEEDPAFVFSMEEEEDSSNARARKRASAGLGMGGGFASYASAAAGRATHGSKESKDSVPVNGR
ncbi:spindle poison sensitivity protein Scp3 [Purpureocillium lavendulum]|uniref:Spindle poison sensitivity protein Scp3 n=1 Tax=Purpureocillium lavendulum TaxID=1247861 RepID=A0AB34FYU0_9HYPO|nr:spindle poison sensitivity protein Scp3 [Purpureocillium lavendulum]